MPEPASLSIATLNLAMEKDSRVILRDLAAAPAVRNADVLLVQEAVHSLAANQGVPGEIARALNRRIVFAPAGPGVYDRGLAILSRYPIHDAHVRTLKIFNLRFHNRDRFALGATVDTPGGPIRFWNVHLDTRINAPERAEQLAPVLDDASSAPGPKVIGGDFNTNDFYWLWNVLPVPRPGAQAGAVERLMSANGFQAPLQDGRATFNRLGMHLDWIYTHALEPKAAAVHDVPFSDHRAVVVRFAKP